MGISFTNLASSPVLHLMRLQADFDKTYNHVGGCTDCEVSRQGFERQAEVYGIRANALFDRLPWLNARDEDGLLLQVRPYIVDFQARYLLLSILFWPQGRRAMPAAGLERLSLDPATSQKALQQLKQRLDTRGYELVADPWLRGKLSVVQQAKA